MLRRRSSTEPHCLVPELEDSTWLTTQTQSRCLAGNYISYQLLQASVDSTADTTSTRTISTMAVNFAPCKPSTRRQLHCQPCQSPTDHHPIQINPHPPNPNAPNLHHPYAHPPAHPSRNPHARNATSPPSPTRTTPGQQRATNAYPPPHNSPTKAATPTSKAGSGSPFDKTTT